MDRERRIIGYGICGPGEAGRYMRETLEEFKRLCDETIILCNNVGPEEKLLCYEFGFQMVQDNREWGKEQWRIKKDFVDEFVSKLAKEGDVMVCLDMDETFDRHLTRDWLLKMPFDAYKVFIVDLWNDPEHYKLESCFWNTRIWRWNGNTEWIVKPVHCGLAPRWAVAYNRYAPFLLIHKGLMLREDRQKKIKRYEKYDPDAKHLAPIYYEMLASDTAKPFDEEAMHATIAKEVETYKQTKPRTKSMAIPRGRFAYVQNPGGVVIDIPEKQLQETLKRKGFVFVGWADDANKEMEELFAEEGDAPEGQSMPTGVPYQAGSYQRSMADEKAEVDDLNAGDDAALATPTARDEAEALPEPEYAQAAPAAPALVMKNRVGMKEGEKIRKAKKAAKKK